MATASEVLDELVTRCSTCRDYERSARAGLAHRGFSEPVLDAIILAFQQGHHADELLTASLAGTL